MNYSFRSINLANDEYACAIASALESIPSVNSESRFTNLIRISLTHNNLTDVGFCKIINGLN